MQGDSTLKTLTVAGLLCIVCSIFVSGAAVMLKPRQDANKALDLKKNLLVSAGLIKAGAKKEVIESVYKSMEIKVVDLSTGEYVDNIDPAKYDQKAAAKDPKQNHRIDAKKDIAKIKIREKLSKVFLAKKDGVVNQIILPVNGKGLWSTLYGFLCLDPDTKTVTGFGFYDHAETPGLGGEIDNPRWKALWKGKVLVDENFKPNLKIIKGSVDPKSVGAQHKVDGLSGATLTAVGVEHLVNYWMGEDGFATYLEKVRAGGML